METYGYPTQFEAVNSLLNALLAQVQAILGEQFVGMYLFGSLTSGDFDEDSDIDVLVVTKQEPAESIFVELQAMHAHLATGDSKWAVQLDISYISLASLRRYDPAKATHLHLDRGPGEMLHWKQHSSGGIVQRYVLYSRGIVVKGPPLKTLIDPVSSSDLRQAMRVLLKNWADQLAQHPEWLRQRGEQSYTALTMCRILYTLQYGEVVSKAAASDWVAEKFGGRWQPLLERAWIGRHNPDLETSPADIAATQWLVRYVLGYASTPVE